MGKVRVLAVIVCMMTTVDFTTADIIREINIDFVTISHAGNGTDPATENLYGAVGYNYRIGKYEVTNAQWDAFTDAAGAPTGNPSTAYDKTAYYTDAQQPTNYVSWYEAAQFCNYLTSGDKSLGAYQLGIDGSITVNRDAAILAYGTVYVIPTENEWYKAAYYKPDDSGYSIYANGTNTDPVAGLETNYDRAIIGGQPWDVGTGTSEQNGTFDMMGNEWEWTETSIDSNRVQRGGAHDYNVECLRSSYWTSDGPDGEGSNAGFRIAEIPEPASAVILALGMFLIASKRK